MIKCPHFVVFKSHSWWMKANMYPHSILSPHIQTHLVRCFLLFQFSKSLPFFILFIPPKVSIPEKKLLRCFRWDSDYIFIPRVTFNFILLPHSILDTNLIWIWYWGFLCLRTLQNLFLSFNLRLAQEEELLQKTEIQAIQFINHPLKCFKDLE